MNFINHAKGHEAFRVTDLIAAGERGEIAVDRRTPAKTPEAAALYALMGDGTIRAGEVITSLYIGRTLVMSDTRDEYRDHVEAIRMANGRVLIHGLGLGCYLKAVLNRETVEHVDVVEKSQDVIDFVGPYFTDDPRLNLIHADALEYRWPPGTRWDCVWHDIWPSKNVDDLEEHSKLLRSFGRRAGWQGAWAHDYLLMRREQYAGSWRL